MLLRAACVRLCSSAAGATEEKAARDVMMPRTVGQHDGYCCSADRRRDKTAMQNHNPEEVLLTTPGGFRNLPSPRNARCPQRDIARREGRKGQ